MVGDVSKAAGLVAVLALVAGCSGAEGQEPSEDAAPLPMSAEPLAEEIEVPPPPFSPGVFPCSDCHDPEITPNTKRRTLTTAHQEITLHHDEEHRWCLDCHSATDRDRLHLASGELVEFSESYKLCGQCHGDKYRDWKAGVHGRRSGDWDGHKTYLLCVQCHNSHSPAFQPLEPKPAPVRPAGPGP
jgi:hypothetical protein